MTVQELIDQLKTLPPDLKVWVSDGGYVEGSTRLTSVEVVSAYEAGLDGDEVGDDEYVYLDDENMDKLNPDDYPYKCTDDYPYKYISAETVEPYPVWSKAIVLIKSTLDG